MNSTLPVEPGLTRRLNMMCAVGAAFILIAGCGGKDAPASSASSASSPASPSASGAPATSAQEAIDIHNIATYPLTEAHVSQVLQVMHTVQSMEKSDPALAATWSNANSTTDSETLDEAVARVSKMPHSAEIFGKAGISPHEFVYTMFSLMYSGMAYQLKQSGQTAAAGKMAGDVSPANMEFVASHPQVIKELSAIDSTENESSE